ncbi:MAG: gliding motility-associated protein GldE [Bacteroidales bacterium]|nr:gliding motility-associated protein GldE [Bacteroidales bacterium]
MVSGSEVAFFSLGPSEIEKLRDKKGKNYRIAHRLIEKPDRLLATILITNNFVNIGIVVLSAFITSSLVDFSDSQTLGFIVQVIIITFIILLFGEVIPKVYAAQFGYRFALLMARPLSILTKVFNPISSFLIYSTSIVNKRLANKKQNISIDDLSNALDLTSEVVSDEENILRGIVKFGNIDVRQIMKPRVDVVSIDIQTRFNELLNIIIDSGYSRIPVFEDTLDNLKGVLYVKDLLPHFQKGNNFKWQTLIRPPYYVPESKMINDLLKEFQTNKIHMAIVIDEYGGSSGIITLEDILEEIVGEISDESDDDENVFTKMDDNTFIFEAKIMLHDFCKAVEMDEALLDDVKGDADTLAGLILELKGEIPRQYDIINCKNFTFTIESVDKRRIKRIKVFIERP